MSSVALAKEPRGALWDPWEVLGLYPKGPYYSCVGVSKAGFRCGWEFWGRQWDASQADLELMSTMHPWQISRDMLNTLARHSLCVDNHQYQASNKVNEWSALIAEHLKRANEQLARADERRIVKSETEEPRMQTSNPSELASLRGQVVESRSTIQALRECEKAKSSTISLLSDRLAASDLIISMMKGTATTNTQRIEELKEQCVAESDRTRAKHELYQEYKDSNTSLRTERDAKEEDVNRLKQDLWNLEADLEENQRAQRSKGKEAENLRQQLNASNALIEELQASTKDARSLQRKIEDINTSLTERNMQVSHLRQETQRLKAQKYFQTFRNHVRLLAKQKKYERTAIENQKLSEQVANLTQRLEEVDMQLAAQDVSFTITTIYRQQGINSFGTAYPILLQTQKRHKGCLCSRVYQTSSTLFTSILQDGSARGLMSTDWPVMIEIARSRSSKRWCFFDKLSSGVRA